jgi:hypothetical protein
VKGNVLLINRVIISNLVERLVEAALFTYELIPLYMPLLPVIQLKPLNSLIIVRKRFFPFHVSL